jgi:hypothetical protein
MIRSDWIAPLALSRGNAGEGLEDLQACRNSRSAARASGSDSHGQYTWEVGRGSNLPGSRTLASSARGPFSVERNLIVVLEPGDVERGPDVCYGAGAWIFVERGDAEDYIGLVVPVGDQV